MEPVVSDEATRAPGYGDETADINDKEKQSAALRWRDFIAQQQQLWLNGSLATEIESKLAIWYTATINTTRIKTRVNNALASLVNGTVPRREAPKVPFTLV